MVSFGSIESALGVLNAGEFAPIGVAGPQRKPGACSIGPKLTANLQLVCNHSNRSNLFNTTFALQTVETILLGHRGTRQQTTDNRQNRQTDRQTGRQADSAFGHSKDLDNPDSNFPVPLQETIAKKELRVFRRAKGIHVHRFPLPDKCGFLASQYKKRSIYHFILFCARQQNYDVILMPKKPAAYCVGLLLGFRYLAALCWH